jgi:RNA-directed DNA polymerase
MTEGDTDILHLQAALKSFQSNGNYLHISPSFRNYSGDKGDADLWETLLRIAKSNVSELTIGIFDCDNLPFMKAKSVDPGEKFKLGEMVYAFFLQKKISSMSVPFCIESLYDRAELQRETAEGR